MFLKYKVLRSWLSMGDFIHRSFAHGSKFVSSSSSQPARSQGIQDHILDRKSGWSDALHCEQGCIALYAAVHCRMHCIVLRKALHSLHECTALCAFMHYIVCMNAHCIVYMN